MIILYGILGYLVIALIISILVEHHNKKITESNERIQKILDGGEESISEFAKEAIESNPNVEHVEWEEFELPSELIEHTRNKLINKRNNQNSIELTNNEIRFNSLVWPVFLIVLFYVMVLHRPKDGETYKEWVRRVEEKK